MQAASFLCSHPSLVMSLSHCSHSASENLMAYFGCHSLVADCFGVGHGVKWASWLGGMGPIQAGPSLSFDLFYL